MIDVSPAELTGQPSKKDNVLVLSTPEPDAPGKYVLVVYRPVPFGYGATVFMVDYVETHFVGEGVPPVVTAYLGKDLVVQFPSTFDYICVTRDAATIISKDQFLKDYGVKTTGVVPPDPEETLARHPGQYV